MIRWINQLRESRSLPVEGYQSLIELCNGSEEMEYLLRMAREVSIEQFGRQIYVRGLIEITNRCRNSCYYCGIRASNREVSRYTLTMEQIAECCREGYALGFRTFVLQGGEDPTMSEEWMVECVSMIRREYPDCAITLSLGERSRECYQRLFDAGANRYLLRQESVSEELYAKLHPSAMSMENRLRCLGRLREIGYQVGTGFMVGAPYQTTDHLVEDLKYIEHLAPEMVGIGSFIPHHATPLASHRAGDIDLTLRLISILRLMLPTALIPSTTALATVAKYGRERGILAGANVVMPNLSPREQRKDYSLYDNKASLGSESAEGLQLLEQRLQKIGYKISYERGDHPTHNREKDV